MNEQTQETMIENFKLGINHKNNKDYKTAFKLLYNAYKSALKLNDSIYMEQCARNLKEVCAILAKTYLEKAKEIFNLEKHSKCRTYLKRARKCARIGIFFEEPYKEKENFNLYNEIEDFWTKNKEKIAEKRRDNFESFKESCSNVLEFIGDCFSGMFESSSVSSTEENSDNDDDGDLELAHKYYNMGVDDYDYGIIRYNQEFYEQAMMYFDSAEQNFIKAQSYLPSGCDEDYSKEIEDARYKYMDARREYTSD